MDDGFSIMLQQTVPASILTRADCAGAMVVCPECRAEIHLVRASYDGRRRAHLSHAVEIKQGESQADADARRDARDAQCTRRAARRKADEDAKLLRDFASDPLAKARARMEPQRIAVALRNMLLEPARLIGDKSVIRLINDIIRHKEMSRMARELLFSDGERTGSVGWMKSRLDEMTTEDGLVKLANTTPLAMAWRLQVAKDIVKAAEADSTNAILIELAISGMVMLAMNSLLTKKEVETDLDGNPLDPRHRMGVAIINASQTSRQKAHRILVGVLHPPRIGSTQSKRFDPRNVDDDQIDGSPIQSITSACIAILAGTPFEHHAEEIRKMLGTRLG